MARGLGIPAPNLNPIVRSIDALSVGRGAEQGCIEEKDYLFLEGPVSSTHGYGHDATDLAHVGINVKESQDPQPRADRSSSPVFPPQGSQSSGAWHSNTSDYRSR